MRHHIVFDKTIIIIIQYKMIWNISETKNRLVNKYKINDFLIAEHFYRIT